MKPFKRPLHDVLQQYYYTHNTQPKKVPPHELTHGSWILTRFSALQFFSLAKLLCRMEDARLPRKARSDPFAYFSRHGPYSMQGNDEIFAAAGKYSDMVGPDVRLNERLHAAAKKGKLKTLKKCLERGANIDARNHVLGWTALHYAAHNEHEKIVRFLVIEANANIEAKSFDGKMPIDLCDLGNTYTFLKRWEKEAARRKRQAAMDILKRSQGNVYNKTLELEKSAADAVNITKPEPNDGTMVIDDIASETGEKSFERMSIHVATSAQRSAYFSVETLCDAMNEKLRQSAANNDIEKLKILLARGVNCNQQSKLTGWAPIHYAAYRGHHECVKVLLEHGADPLQETVNGKTAWALCGTTAGESYALIKKWVYRKNTDKKYRSKRSRLRKTQKSGMHQSAWK